MYWEGKNDQRHQQEKREKQRETVPKNSGRSGVGHNPLGTMTAGGGGKVSVNGENENVERSSVEKGGNLGSKQTKTELVREYSL